MLSNTYTQLRLLLLNLPEVKVLRLDRDDEILRLNASETDIKSSAISLHFPFRTLLSVGVLNSPVLTCHIRISLFMSQTTRRICDVVYWFSCESKTIFCILVSIFYYDFRLFFVIWLIFFSNLDVKKVLD